MASQRGFVLLALLSVCCACLPIGGQAWWCDGHMLTATIAKRLLPAEVVAQVSPLIEYLADDYPESPDFVASACWADDLKGLGVETNNDWHYINLPYVKKALFGPTPAIGNSSNVAWAIRETNYTLGYYKAKKLDQARALRFLIHFAGDIHQPLHAATMFDQNVFPPPVGDEGGNKFPIQGANQSELHAFWDSGAGQWQADQWRPLNSSGTAWLDGWATKITDAYPRSAFKQRLTLSDPYEWAEGSFALAVQAAYATSYNGTLTAEYVTKARQICQQQIAIGGYRLADTLMAVFAPSEDA